MGAKPKLKWKHGPDCPMGRTFGEILEWHLLYWGTGNNGSGQKERGEPWKLDRFSAEIHGKTVLTDRESRTYGQKLMNWRTNVWLPENEGVLDAILYTLFDRNPHLKSWKDDLERAWHDDKKAKADALIAPVGSLSEFPTGFGRLGADAREGVAALASALGEHFYGRDGDLALIDGFVGSRMANENKGLLLITAPAGFGKSALAVKWCRAAEKVPNRYIANHFCSISAGTATTTLDNIFANLRRQLVMLYGDSIGNCSDKDAVVGMLAVAPPGDKQLVLWLDGIDEADELVECFVPILLGERICIIVSARADLGVTPAYVDEWQFSVRAREYKPLRRDLLKLTLGDVEDMAAGMFAKRGFALPYGLARPIHETEVPGLLGGDAFSVM